MTGSPVVLLLLEGTYPWYRGGVSEWVARYLEAFPDYQFKILQVATDEYLNRELNASLYEIPDNVVSFVRIPPPDLSRDWREESVDWYHKNEPEIIPLLKNVHAIHVTNTGFAGWLGTVLSRELRVPSILTEHAIYWKEIDMGAIALECGYKIPSEISEKHRFVEMFRSMAKEIYRNADRIISVSECNIGEQEELGARNSVHIPNGVSEAFFNDSSLDADRKALTIGWIGRCANMKNPLRFFTLIDAFRKQESFPVSFVMMLSDAGEKNLEGDVRKKAEKYPELKIIWNQPAIRYINEMDALCISSYNESQPLVLFEALASKSLPVGWKAGDANEKYGIFIEQESEAGPLRDKISELWLDTRKWAEEVESRFQYLKTQHTWQIIFGRYRKIFEEMY